MKLKDVYFCAKTIEIHAYERSSKSSGKLHIINTVYAFQKFFCNKVNFFFYPFYTKYLEYPYIYAKLLQRLEWLILYMNTVRPQYPEIWPNNILGIFR